MSERLRCLSSMIIILTAIQCYPSSCNRHRHQDTELGSAHLDTSSSDPHRTRVTNDETELVNDLFSGYSKVARPVLNMSHIVKVEFSFGLISIQLEEANERLKSFVWLMQRWRDERLEWEPREYGNITTLNIPNSMVWLPDSYLYYHRLNSDESGYITSLDNLQVNHTGFITWYPPATLLSPCVIDVTYYPFDKQICSLTIGPWGYHIGQVSYALAQEKVDLKNFKPSDSWKLIEANISRYVHLYEDLGMSYSLIDVTLQIRRKSLYFWLNIIVPCLILNSLGIGLFILPPDSGQKISFGLGILLTLFVFALVVNENIPRTSDYIPILGIYLIVIMWMISCSLFLAMIIENIHHRRPKLHSPPRWIQQVVLTKLPKLLCIDTVELRDKASFGSHPLDESRQNTVDKMSTNEALDSNSGALLWGAREQDIAKKWILIALVLDKLLFWGFLIVLVISNGIVLIIVPSAQ